MSMTVNIIGAGLLGKTLGFLLHQHQLVKLEGICNRSLDSAQQAVDFIGAGFPLDDINALPAADITFITTPDAYIRTASNKLCQNRCLKPGSIIVHCSGALTSSELIAVKNKGCFVASVHPMRSFANPTLSAAHYQGTYCAMEGDEETLDVIMQLFTAIGSKTCVIHPDKKPLYHAAAVFSSNYLVTLAHQAQTCFKEAGLADRDAMNILTSLMKTTLTNLEQVKTPYHALTGPIKRGDTSTVEIHMNALQNSQQKHLYALLGLATCNLSTPALDQTKLLQLTALLQP